MKWFTNPQTLEELKKEYKRLAMKHHPDIGGNDSDMKEINPQKLHMDICGVNKKYKLGLTNPSVDQVAEWISKI